MPVVSLDLARFYTRSQQFSMCCLRGFAENEKKPCFMRNWRSFGADAPKRANSVWGGNT